MDSRKKLFLILSVVGPMISSVASVRPALLLTPYIEENRLEEARNQSFVDPKFFLNVNSYSGFFTVDKKYNSNVFFWYFPVANKVVEDTPWIIWLQGGPGGTSLVGLFDEMGPFEYVNGSLKFRDTSWWNEYSMLFIDNPVGAGFSFTNHLDGLPRNMETYGNHLFSTVQQFLTIFPELRQAPLYVAGSSYAGRYVPALATKIHEADKNHLKLQGLILGNPVLNSESVMDYTTHFYQWGLIDQQGVLTVKPLQDKYNAAVLNEHNELAFHLRDELLDKLQDISYQNQLYNLLNDDANSLRSFVRFITTYNVREAIHVGSLEFTFVNASVHKSLAPDFLLKVAQKIESLLEHYSVLIYCGQLDLTAPCVQAAAPRRSWRWSGRQQFLAAPRRPWWFRGSVAGYIKSGGGLTEVLVRGAGHLAPMDKPAQVQQLVSYFIQGKDLETPPNYQDGPQSEYEDLKEDGTSNVSLIVSVFFNILLIIFIIASVMWFISWKRKNDTLFMPLRDDIFNLS